MKGPTLKACPTTKYKWSCLEGSLLAGLNIIFPPVTCNQNSDLKLTADYAKRNIKHTLYSHVFDEMVCHYQSWKKLVWVAKAISQKAWHHILRYSKDWV